MIKVSDIVKIYKNGSMELKVLKGLNLSVSEGEYVAFMGPSGSGKSTLMNILGCLDSLTSGTYILDNQDVSTIKGNALAEIRNKKIGFVFQTFNLLPKMTAVENVALPALYAGVKKAERIKREENKTENISGESAYGLTSDSIIGNIIDKYPYIKEFMPTLSPVYNRLLNPVQYMIMSKVATLDMIAARGGFEVADLIKKIEDKIKEEENK